MCAQRPRCGHCHASGHCPGAAGAQSWPATGCHTLCISRARPPLTQSQPRQRGCEELTSQMRDLGHHHPPLRSHGREGAQSEPQRRGRPQSPDPPLLPGPRRRNGGRPPSRPRQAPVASCRCCPHCPHPPGRRRLSYPECRRRVASGPAWDGHTAPPGPGRARTPHPPALAGPLRRPWAPGVGSGEQAHAAQGPPHVCPRPARDRKWGW